MTLSGATDSIGAPLLVVAGPTASGKSALAISLARELRGEIVNLDSVQVYRGFDIGSAKLSRDERAGIPHHLIDAWEPNQQVDAAKYVNAADAVIAEIQSRGNQVVISGGTTMYLTALLHGLAPMRGRNRELREEFESCPSASLYRELLTLDPLAAERLHPNDRVRIIRALEVVRDGAQSMGNAHAEHRFGELRYRALVLVLARPRVDLYARIDRRAAQMVERGIVDEVRRLENSFDASLHGFRSLGYAQVRRLLAGEIASSELAQEIALRTRQFAKRQLTYWKNEPRKRGWRVYPTAPPDNSVNRGATQDLLALDLNWETLLLSTREYLRTAREGVEVWTINAIPLADRC